MQNYCGNSKPTSQIYFESFRNNFGLKRNMFDSSKGNVHTFTKMFQYEIINNVTYLNKILFFLKKTLLDDYILFLNQKMKHQFTFSLTV